MGAAEDLFKQLTENGMTAITGMIGSQEEHLYLDFVRKKVSNTADLHEDDINNYSKALSGFANSDGGVLCWGVKCKGKPDVASELVPINPLKQFINNLNRITGRIITPIVDGVLNMPIEDSEGSDKGFVATFIPRSDSRPHRARDREFYKRSGDSFYKMEHFDLEDMFGRGNKPKLRLTFAADKPSVTYGQGKPSVGVKVWLVLENYGQGIAKYPYLHILELEPRYDYKVFPGEFEMAAIGKSYKKFAGHSGTALLPGASFKAAFITGNVTVGGRQIGGRLRAMQSVPPDMKVTYRIGSEGFSILEGTLTVPGRDMIVKIESD